jgi:alpha-L-fucosidase
MTRPIAIAACILAATLLNPHGARPQPQGGLGGNKPERVEWFRDLGFGLFIHWSVDSQIGSVISHSVVGADADYLKRFFELLPRSFNPHKFRPRDWAVLARLAGMKYVVFTAKHHSGFCMYETKTTPYSIMRTPYGKDITAELMKAFRDEGLAIGLYFSPDDFHYLYTGGKVIDRAPRPGVTPQEDEGLMALDREQLRELMTKYGPIDVMFLDGPAEGLRDVCWREQPDVVVTRGAMETPEQRIPGVAMDRAWEACITMGTQWHYKPTHETYKSGTQLIEMLIETRAKGGNLLLNVGPKPDGELPIEQEERLREIALWNFAFGESIGDVRPWVVTNEGDVWFTKKKNENTVYAFITKAGEWMLGDSRTITLRSVKATARTRISVLSQTGEVLEYRPDVEPRPRWRQEPGGLQITVTMAQRLYNDRRWPNPVVIKITGAEAGLRPPTIEASSSSRGLGAVSATLSARLTSLGEAAAVDVGFQYRRQRRTEELYGQDQPWQATALKPMKAPGEFRMTVEGLDPTEQYEFRALVKHPLLTVFGEERPVGTR